MRIQALDYDIDEARILAKWIARCDLDARVPIASGIDEFRDRFADVEAGGEKMEMDENLAGSGADECVDCPFEAGRRELHVGMPDEPLRALARDALGEAGERCVGRVAARAMVDDQQTSGFFRGRSRHRMTYLPRYLPTYQ